MLPIEDVMHAAEPPSPVFETGTQSVGIETSVDFDFDAVLLRSTPNRSARKIDASKPKSHAFGWQTEEGDELEDE